MCCLLCAVVIRRSSLSGVTIIYSSQAQHDLFALRLVSVWFLTCRHLIHMMVDSLILGGLIVVLPTPGLGAQEDWEHQCFRLFRHLSAGDDVLIRSKSVA